MYRYDFTKLSPLEWFTLGMYTDNVPYVYAYYLMSKCAEYEFSDLPIVEAVQAAHDFIRQSVVYLSSFSIAPPNSPDEVITGETEDRVPEVFKSFIRSLEGF